MCRRVTCEKCGKPSYAGCGAHIEMVLGDVPKSDRCACREAKAMSAETRSATSPASPRPRLWKGVWPFG
jgi:hypothetical protein